MKKINKNYLERYSRQIVLKNIGIVGQKKISSSKIFIVGAGGLGCPAALYLATAGVKTIRWVDPDKVDVSNLPRQILFSENDLDVPKVTVGKKMLNRIVPAVDVDAIEEKADETNLTKLISGCNIVLDCTDQFKTRHLINKYCVKNKIPLVIGSAVGWSGQLMVVNSLEQNTACYACVFEENQEFIDDPCGAFGIFSSLVGTVGLLQAGEAIKTLLKINETTGKLLLLNALSLNFDRINLTKNINCNVCS